MRAFQARARRLVPSTALWLYHFLLAALAAVRYDFPSRRLIVIGVTGTDGKTTVVHLLHEMLAAAGHPVGSLSSLRFKVNEREEPNLLKMTMPGRLRLQRFLADCRAARCRFAIIEVTSQGILQSRHRFIRFSSAVLTNISPEHIEAHGGFERYRSSKLELFRRLPRSGWAVLNQEDSSSKLFAACTRARIVWYSHSAVELAGVCHPVQLSSVSPDRIQFAIRDTRLDVGLGGEFNVMNALAAAGVALAYGISLSVIANAASRIRGVPGRLEFVQREPFAVVVDYANTPRAYESVYATLAGDVQTGQRAGRGAAETKKLICVFGAPGGGRDRWKRPELGRIAGRYCREIVLTTDDADEENPANIAEEIQSGVPEDKRQRAKVIPDRREAIREALSSARAGDTVVITGMGAQPRIVINGKKIPWDDREVVRDELATLPER